MRRLATAAVALAVVAVGCSDSPSTGSSSTEVTTRPQSSTTVQAYEESAFGVVLGGVSDGEVPVDVALQAFTLAFGPLPGVETPSGSPTIRSGSGVLRWIRANWDSLTTEQQVAVAQYEGTAEVAGASFLPIDALFGGAAEVDSVALLGLIDQIVAKIEAESGLTLTAEIELVVAPETVLASDPKALAWATPFGTGGLWSGDMTLCRITIGKAGIGIADGVDAQGVASEALHALMAHEVFHCFEGDYSTLEEAAMRPPWVAEGLAEWVALTVGAPNVTGPDVGEWWFRWLQVPEISLFDRTYDALGFFAHVDATGTHMWSALGPILAAASNGNEAAYAAATSVSGGDFLDTWAPGVVRDPTRMPEWDTEGPGIPLAARNTPNDVGPLADGGEVALGAAAYAGVVWTTDVQAEVAVLAGEGSGMVVLPDGASATRADTVGRPLCTIPGGCTCPEGSPGASAVFRLVPKGEMTVAVTGGPADNLATLLGFSLEDFCARETCPVGSWVSIRWEVPNIDTAFGAGTMILTIDSQLDSVVEFDPDFPLYAIAESEGAVRVKLVFDGSYGFKIGTLGVPTGSARVTTYADLGGEWVQTAEPIDLTSGGMGYIADSNFTCEGDELIVTSVDPVGGRLIFIAWP